MAGVTEKTMIGGIKEISKEQCVYGNSYLVKRETTLWSIAQFYINEHDVAIWHHQDGLTDEPVRIYLLPINI